MNVVSRTLWLLIILIGPIYGSGQDGKTPVAYVMYKPNWQPLKADPELYKKWMTLTQEGVQQGNSRKLLEKKRALMEAVLKGNPSWKDGFWIHANTLVTYGETLSSGDEEASKIARTYLVEARDNAKACLKLDPQHIICQFYLAVSVAKIATIDGIMSSVGRGEFVHKTLRQVYASNTDYVLPEGQSLQGIVRYALGIFYRVVPDFFLMRWLFNISGDIDKSVQMHEEALQFPGTEGPCWKLMLAVALLCQADGEDGPIKRRADNLLDQIPHSKKTDDAAMVCINDAPRLKKNPDDACGYTKAQVQTRDEESLKNHQP